MRRPACQEDSYVCYRNRSAASQSRARVHRIAAQDVDRRQVGRGRFRQDFPGLQPGHRRRDGAGRRRRSRGHRSRRQSSAQGLRRRSVVDDDLVRARPADLEAGRPDRRAPGRVRATGVAGQRQAAGSRARCRRAAGHRPVPLHGGLGDQDRRQHHSDLGRRRQGKVLRLHAARADRRRRADHSLELPAADGRMEAGSRAGHRLHRRAEAGGADAAERAAAGAN